MTETTAPIPRVSFIADGYTREQTLEATEFYDEVTISYRPMVSHERESVLARMRFAGKVPEGKDPTPFILAAEAVAAEALAMHIKMWNVTTDKGDPVEITKANCMKLEAHLSADLYFVVSGLFDEIKVKKLRDDAAEKAKADQAEQDAKN